MTLPPLISPSFWFGLNPGPFLPWADRFLLVFFSLFLVAGIVLWLVTLRQGLEKMLRRGLKQAAGYLVVLGLFGLLLYFFTYEHTPVLSMRFGYLLWLGVAAWFGWMMYHYVTVDMARVETLRAEREKQQRWTSR